MHRVFGILRGLSINVDGSSDDAVVGGVGGGFAVEHGFVACGGSVVMILLAGIVFPGRTGSMLFSWSRDRGISSSGAGVSSIVIVLV